MTLRALKKDGDNVPGICLSKKENLDETPFYFVVAQDFEEKRKNASKISLKA